MSDGHIKLHRKIIESPVFSHPLGLKIWIWCLCKATYVEKSLPIKTGKGFTIAELKRGQFVFGRYKAEDELGIDASTIYKWVHKLQEMEMIIIESNSHYSIITICNWDVYQLNNDQEYEYSNTQVTGKEQPSNNQVTTKEHPSNTNNNIKKENNNINNIKWRTDFSTYLNDCKTAFRRFYEDKEFIKSQEFYNPGVNVQKSLMKAYENFWGTEAGWEFKKKKRTKEINWKQTITNAIGLNKVYYTKEEKAQ